MGDNADMGDMGDNADITGGDNLNSNLGGAIMDNTNLDATNNLGENNDGSAMDGGDIINNMDGSNIVGGDMSELHPNDMTGGVGMTDANASNAVDGNDGGEGNQNGDDGNMDDGKMDVDIEPEPKEDSIKSEELDLISNPIDVEVPKEFDMRAFDAEFDPNNENYILPDKIFLDVDLDYINDVGDVEESVDNIENNDDNINDDLDKDLK
jgi:hypothetical protein